MNNDSDSISHKLYDRSEYGRAQNIMKLNMD